MSAALQTSLRRTDICVSVLLRVTNSVLTEAFEARCHAIEADRGKAPEVRTVYHGTSMASAEAIAAVGFDPMCSRIAAYGRGTYCSPAVKMALGYCKDVRGREDFSMVFQCKFAAGLFTPTGSGEPIVGDYGGNGAHGNILVTPYKDGILPEYLICYYSWA